MQGLTLLSRRGGSGLGLGFDLGIEIEILLLRLIEVAFSFSLCEHTVTVKLHTLELNSVNDIKIVYQEQ